MASALSVAISDLNGKALLEGYTLAFQWKDSQCDAGKALLGLSQLLDDNDVDVLIGPGCSSGCLSTQQLANEVNLAQESNTVQPEFV